MVAANSDPANPFRRVQIRNQAVDIVADGVVEWVADDIARHSRKDTVHPYPSYRGRNRLRAIIWIETEWMSNLEASTSWPDLPC